jgi:cytochrome c peroxidase
MKKLTAIALLVALAVALHACRKTEKPTITSTISGQTVTLDLPPSVAPYFPGNDNFNRVATLGRVLFYDSHLSANNAVSCASCHKQAFGFADNTAFSFGFENGATKRNTPGITQMKPFGPFFWDGREQDLKNLIMLPVTNHVEMGIEDASVLPGKLAALPYYHNLFGKAFGDSSITVDRISEAVSLFLQAIGTGSQSRFEMFSSGAQSALNSQEAYGMTLFDNTYNCRSCHGGGPSGYSGNDEFRDIGLDSRPQDGGQGAITGNASDIGKFKVPNLRNVALTAPYMHDGRFTTLEQVVAHYSDSIKSSANLAPELRDQYGNAKSFNISDSDKAAIVAFLKTLTDYKTTTDDKFSSPFKVK